MSRLIRHFEENTKGCDFVVGDIHGCFTLLKDKLKNIGFDESKDRLFSVGDLVDRGSESEQCLEWLDKTFFFAVLGNHESMMIDYAINPENNERHYFANGGNWTKSLSSDELKKYAMAFQDLPLAVDIKTKDGLIGIVHADPVLKDWNDLVEELGLGRIPPRLREELVWSRSRIFNMDRTEIKNVKSIYVGHSVVNRPCQLGNVNYIDTGAVFGLGLTILRIN